MDPLTNAADYLSPLESRQAVREEAGRALVKVARAPRAAGQPPQLQALLVHVLGRALAAARADEPAALGVVGDAGPGGEDAAELRGGGGIEGRVDGLEADAAGPRLPCSGLLPPASVGGSGRGV
jgi:hypothetical protein